MVHTPAAAWADETLVAAQHALPRRLADHEVLDLEPAVDAVVAAGPDEARGGNAAPILGRRHPDLAATAADTVRAQDVAGNDVCAAQVHAQKRQRLQVLNDLERHAGATAASAPDLRREAPRSDVREGLDREGLELVPDRRRGLGLLRSGPRLAVRPCLLASAHLIVGAQSDHRIGMMPRP